MPPKVLLVDYAPRSIERIRSVLSDSGYLVFVAKDGVEGLQAVDEAEPDIVILQDLIPKKHGYDVCREIKGRDDGKSIPVVILTSARVTRNNELIDTGCDGYLKKPFDDEALVRAIQGFVPSNAQAEPVAEEAAAVERPDAKAVAPAPPPSTDHEDLDSALDAAFSPLRREAV